MTRKIPYKNKITSAKTVYCDIAPADKQWVIDKCKEIDSLEKLLRNNNCVPAANNIVNPNKNLPKQGTGKANSIHSAATGIVDNLTTGTQRNLSSKTRTLLEKTFKEMNSIINTFEEVEFVEQTQAGVDIDMSSGTTLSDLFDVESFTVTYKRKEPDVIDK